MGAAEQACLRAPRLAAHFQGVRQQALPILTCMRTRTRVVIAAGLFVELLLALFPPMRFALAPEPGGVLAGRTEHFFLFSRTGGAWSIDVGRFITYSAAIVVLAAIVALLESWHHHPTSRAPR